MCTLGFRVPSCRNLFKKPWAFIRVPYMNPTMLGLNAESFFIRFLHYIILKHHNELWGITMAKNFLCSSSGFDICFLSTLPTCPVSSGN